jgi:hypothetical protein
VEDGAAKREVDGVVVDVSVVSPEGGCLDQADAEWMVIRRPLCGHNDTPFGWPTADRPIGRPGVGHPKGVFGVSSYY